MTTTASARWFEVDHKGLGQILERRGKAFAVLELVSNCLDTAATHIRVTLDPVPETRGRYWLVVEDDDPDGFHDLTHAYTLFAPSSRAGDAEKRGRFNLGEKLVLAICDDATIVSTKGGVHFGDGGRQPVRERRANGTRFEATLRMNRDDFSEVAGAMYSLLVNVPVEFNGTLIEPRQPIHTFTAALPTEVPDDEGRLRRTTRKTAVAVYEPTSGEVAAVYELGIPVVETDDRWHVVVGQKVPLTMERDALPPAYLRTLRTFVANEMRDRITMAEATSTWVAEALADPRVEPATVVSAIKARYGDKAVIYDPSDPEANNLAVSRGYTVVHGGAFSADQWSNIKAAEALKPAGQVTPSDRPYSDDPSAPPVVVIPEAQWSAGMRDTVELARCLFRLLLGRNVSVRIVRTTNNFLACYGPSSSLDLNLGRLGHLWFNGDMQDKLRLLLHEAAHEYESNHLSERFLDHVADLGAQLALAAVRGEAGFLTESVLDA